MKTQAALSTLAEWIQGRDLADLPPARLDLVKRHILDCWGARLAGSRLDEGVAVSRVAGSMPDGVVARVVAGTAHTRCTEIDDIHLASCTTPGSVVVPTAMALAADGMLRSVRDFGAAVVAGYESLIRLGVALDGPAALHRNVWPTHAAAAFGSAAVACRAYRLTADQTAGALMTALAGGSGPPVSGAPPASSRWLTLGIAAASGVLAARAAGEGLVGTADLTVSPARLTAGLGRRYFFDDVGTKPFPTARQGLAAIEAACAIAETEQLDADEIDEIVVSVPELQRKVVDRPGIPASRFASIVSVQYQIALALVEPERLFDVARTPPLSGQRLRRLMLKVRVRRARDLDVRYPTAWPARVEIKARRRWHERLVLHAHGDARRPLGWDDLTRKVVALAVPTVGRISAEQAVAGLRHAGARSLMPHLWDWS